MHVVAMRGPEVCKEGIAQGIEFDPLEVNRGRRFPLVERGCTDGVDRAGSTGRSHARGVMGERRLGEQQRCCGRRDDELGRHEGVPWQSEVKAWAVPKRSATTQEAKEVERWRARR